MTCWNEQQRWLTDGHKKNLKLERRLHKLEQSICDELHFVEFMDLDGHHAYNSYKRLHQYRLERRLAKNEQEVLNILTQTLGYTPGRLGDLVKKALNCINGGGMHPAQLGPWKTIV